MKRRNLDAPTTLRDLDDMAVHIITAISKTLESYPTKEDLKVEIRKSEQKLEAKIDDVASDVSDIRRRVIDLEMDHVTRSEFNDLKSKVLPA